MRYSLSLIIGIFFLTLLPSFLYSQETKVKVEAPERVEAGEVIEPKDKTSLVYYPVPYVPVLRELDYKSDRSALLKTGKQVTGMLIFSGRIKASALVEFYRTQMRLQDWEEVGVFSSKVNFLAFKRPQGTVFIIINEGPFSTELSLVLMLHGVN